MNMRRYLDALTKKYLQEMSEADSPPSPRRKIKSNLNAALEAFLKSYGGEAAAVSSGQCHDECEDETHGHDSRRGRFGGAASGDVGMDDVDDDRDQRDYKTDPNAGHGGVGDVEPLDDDEMDDEEEAEGRGTYEGSEDFEPDGHSLAPTSEDEDAAGMEPVTEGKVSVKCPECKHTFKVMPPKGHRLAEEVEGVKSARIATACPECEQEFEVVAPKGYSYLKGTKESAAQAFWRRYLKESRDAGGSQLSS